MSAIEATKLASRGYAAYYGDVRCQLTSEFAADVRWLTASLFALNAGGLVTVSGLKHSGQAQYASALLFWVGILAAFSFVLYSQKKTKSFVSTISGLQESYLLAEATGELDIVRIARLETAKLLVKSSFATPIAVASFAMFTAGLVAIGVLN